MFISKESQVVFGKNSDRGIKRTHNEDSCDLFTTLVQRDASPDSTVKEKAHVAVVADGVGGTIGGEVASNLAVASVKRVMMAQQMLNDSIPERLEEAILQANGAICEQAAMNPELRQMATTIVVAVIAHNRLYVSHVGDSRAYLVRQDAIYQLTIDHTWVQEAIAANRLTSQEAKEHPNRHVVKRYLGINSLEATHNMVDIYHAQGAKGQAPTRRSLELEAGDVVILCSDGLTDLVTDKKIRAVVKKNKGDPQMVADELIRVANAKGGKDNITVVVMALKGEANSEMALPVMSELILLALALLLVMLLVGGAIVLFIAFWPG